MTRVKVCGITRVEDARAAVACGASAVGLVFWPESPRAVTPERARSIAEILPPFVTMVGVFVDEAPSRIEALAGALRLGAVQLHGSEDDVAIERLVRRHRVIRAIGLGASVGGDGWWRLVRSDVTLLVDADDPVRKGGTGRRANWDAAAEAARERPLILSGGLTADSVGEAIRQVRPFAVDVSSGVEREPGVKDPVRLAAFFEAVRNHDRERHDQARR